MGASCISAKVRGKTPTFLQTPSGYEYNFQGYFRALLNCFVFTFRVNHCERTLRYFCSCPILFLREIQFTFVLVAIRGTLLCYFRELLTSVLNIMHSNFVKELNKGTFSRPYHIIVTIGLAKYDCLAQLPTFQWFWYVLCLIRLDASAKYKPTSTP